MKQKTKLPSIYSNLAGVRQALDNIFEPSWLDRETWLTNVVDTDWAPTVDIKEDEHQYLVQADIPGVDPKNIDVTIDKGILTIKGHKESETKEERKNYVHIERSQGSFYRTLSLSNTGDVTKVTAKSKNGVIEIVVPKTNDGSSRKIKIKEE